MSQPGFHELWIPWRLFKPQLRLSLFKSIMVLFEKAYPSFSGFVVDGCLQQSLAIVVSAV